MATKKKGGFKSLIQALFGPKENKTPAIKKDPPAPAHKSKSGGLPASSKPPNVVKLEQDIRKILRGVSPRGSRTGAAGMSAAGFGSTPAPQPRRGNRLVFLIDATSSREEAWRQAQEIQIHMFDTAAQFGQLELRLMYFGGDYFRDTGWRTDPHYLRQEMMQVQCLIGLTNYYQAFETLAREEDLDCVVMVGDHFEHYGEYETRIYKIANELGLRKIPVIALHEGNQQEWPFRHIAEISGGAFLKFGPGINLALSDCLISVAALATGGRKALAKQQEKGVTAAGKIEEQLKLNEAKPQQFALKKPT